MKRRQYLDDFIELARLCDKIDGLDMYFVGDSATLAYALERLSEKPSYADTVARWKVLAKEQNCNELSWSIIQAAMDSIDTDPGVSLRDEAAARRRAAIYHEMYNRNELCMFSVVSKNMIPFWFWAWFRFYTTNDILRNRDESISYCQERGMSAEEAEEFYNKFMSGSVIAKGLNNAVEFGRDAYKAISQVDVSQALNKVKRLSALPFKTIKKFKRKSSIEQAESVSHKEEVNEEKSDESAE